MGLYRKYSIIALFAAVLSISCYTYSLTGDIVLVIQDGKSVSRLLHYFTILSGLYGEFVSCFLIAFAIEGVIKKRFTYPRWAALLHYSSVICTTLVFIFATVFISRVDIYKAFGGNNLYLHVFCPILILISFFMVESRHFFSLKDLLICIIPVFLYGAVYWYKVFFKEDWDDIYSFGSLPLILSALLVLSQAFVIALVLRWLNNKKNGFIKKQLTKNWEDGLDEVSIKIEAYGLGRYMGLHGDMNNINLNLDILQDMSEKYHIKIEELTKAYTKGAIEGFKEVRGDISPY